MKKIILILLVLLCGMSLFAETYTSTFYVGARTLIDGYDDFRPLNFGYDRYFFTKIFQTDSGFYEVEITAEENALSSTYQVKKGDIIPVNFEDVPDGNLIVTDIKPNQITLQVQ